MKRILPIVLFACACSDNATPPPERDAFMPGDSIAFDCVPNLDEQIDADELPIGIGADVTYRINPTASERTVDLIGLVDQNGVRVWDWSTDFSDDQALTISPSELSGKWYSTEFPEGEFVSPLDAAGTLDAIYRKTDAAILLLGYASTEEAPEVGQTLVSYDAPVVVYQLPLRVGDTWTSVGEVSNAVVRDLPYAGRDIYTTTVDAVGEVWLPDLRFEKALRVRTDLTIEPSVGEGVTRKQVSYVFECFGEVARAVSQNNETEDNFETAVEVRLLGF